MKNPPLILVVDDSPSQRLLVGAILSKEGFSVIYAEDGIKAYKLAKESYPDLILLDVLMPRMDGFETLKLLKSDPVTADIPILFLSAADKTEDKVKGLTAGGVDYITKPIESSELLARIKVHLKIKEYIERLQHLQKEQLKGLETVQRAILTTPEELPDARFRVYYKPLGGVGGDFYDVLQIGSNVFGFFLGDVSGHDLKAAFVTSALKVIIAQNFSVINSLTDLFKSIQNILCPLIPEEMFLTAVAIKLNRNSLILDYITAGHPPIIVFCKKGNTKFLSTENNILCALPNFSFKEHSIRVNKGDKIVLYSDGLYESVKPKNKGLTEILERLANVGKTLINLDLESFLTTLVSAFLTEKNLQSDDITVLAIEV